MKTLYETPEKFVVVLADGEFPQTPQARRFFDDAATLVCCDGAAEKAVAAGREPDFVVGDLDSISPELAARFRERLVRVAEQETNDLTKALRFCAARGWFDVVVLGATGGREDHSLGNLARFAEFSQIAPNARLVTDSGVFVAAFSSRSFRTTPGRQISIFSFDPRQEITSRGLKYPLNRLRLPNWATATLNESLDDEFSLEFDGTTPLLIFFADEVK